LTGCSATGKLYCWPCLLFVAEKGIWNGAGFSDINFLKASGRREKTQSYLCAITALKTFGFIRMDTQLYEQR
jgi:hypothetical protein